jgi:putative transport protein
VAELLADNPILIFFIVVAIGYPLGRVRVGGFRLGVASVLFSGLAVGALDQRFALPSTLYLFGLTLFIYTIGLASGPSFVASFKRQGVRDNLLVLVLLLLAGGMTAALHTLFRLRTTTSAGLFAGSLTNTPALASVLERLTDESASVQAEPVVAYAVSYPLGVVGVIVAIVLMQRLFKTDYTSEARALRDLGASGEHLVNMTVRITRPDIADISVAGWREKGGWQVIFGRFRRGNITQLVYPYTVLHPGDEVSVIGSDEAVNKVTAFLGEVTGTHLEFDRSELDFRRIFVSNLDVADKTLAELSLPQRYGVLITRIRRGDVDMLPHGHTRLELGDRVRILARREVMPEMTKLFGDSYKALSEVNMLPLSLGIILGLLLGFIPIPLPGGLTFTLGIAGGPLVVALILGTLGRTGRLVWQLPYSANLTFRQLGLVLFLAGVGTRSGYAFIQTLISREGLVLLLSGAAITLTTALLTLIIGHKVYHIPMSLLTGMLAGLQTQPAVLGFASEQTGNDLPTIGYATVFPLATIVKILVAQLLMLFL